MPQPGRGYPQKMAIGSRSISVRRSSMCGDGSSWSYRWKRRLRSRQYSVQVLVAWVYRSRAMGNRVHSGPTPWRQGGRHSTIVRCRDPMSHSTRTWSRACGGTRCSHQRRTRAMSSSGSPAMRSAFQAVTDVGGVAHPVTGGGVLPGDGDFDVDAEQAGEDRGGEFRGEPEQRGGAGWPGVDANLVEPFGAPAGADRLPGPSAGKQ